MSKFISILTIVGLVFTQSNNNSDLTNYNKCGTLDPTAELIIPENEILDWIDSSPSHQSRTTLNIPIAFHVIYENIAVI